MPEKCCEDCKWWDNSMSSAQADVETGACRGAVPGFDSRTSLAVWPFTEPGDWCAAFVAAERMPDL